MTMKAMMKRHVNRFIICIPALRDAVTNRPTTFKVLNTCRSADEACEALENYEKEGGDYANTIIVPNFPEELNENPPELCPSKVAKMFRVLYGINVNIKMYIFDHLKMYRFAYSSS